MSRDLLQDSPGFNHCVRAREGYVLYNRNDTYVGRSIERYGEFSESEAVLLRSLLPTGGVAVEVGANIGTHTLVLARAAGPAGWVVAYEPQRIVFQTLCANLALNSLTNVDARASAAGAEDGWVVIPDLDYDAPDNFGAVDVARFTEGRRVPKVMLDTDLDVPRLDLLKIDVQGMELEVLRGAEGAIGAHQPVLYVENDLVDRSPALIEHLLGLDYRLYWHYPPLFNPDNFFAEKENLFPDVVSINMLCIPRDREQQVWLEEVTGPGAHPMEKIAGMRAGSG